MRCNCRIKKLLSFKTVYGLTAPPKTGGRDRGCTYPGNELPNIGFPLLDCPRVASSSMTSQCSTKTPSSMTRMSAAIQLAGAPKTGKASVNDHEIALGHDHVVLVFQRVRQTLNESEEAGASRGRVGTVLNVIR